MKRADVLSAAGKAVADRGLNYGQPEDNFERIARRWNVHLQNRGTRALTGADVAVMMVDVKLARLENDPTHADSWIDIAGYAACGSECAGERADDRAKALGDYVHAQQAASDRLVAATEARLRHNADPETRHGGQPVDTPRDLQRVCPTTGRWIARDLP